MHSTNERQKTYVLKYVLKSLEVNNDKEKEKGLYVFQMKKEILHAKLKLRTNNHGWKGRGRKAKRQHQ